LYKSVILPFLTGLVGIPDINRQLGRRRHKWQDNIKTDFEGIEKEGVKWIVVTHYKDKWWALVKAGMNFIL
jgi:hypothetical protein